MIILISGATHSGKTALSQKLMEKNHIPYFSIDHLKMGLIRSKKTNLTPYDDEKLKLLLWPIIKEMIKTLIENNQSLIIEGDYIPFDFKKEFTVDELNQIRFICLIFTEKYIKTHFQDILNYESVIEKRKCLNDIDMNHLIKDHQEHLNMCIKNQLPYTLIDQNYELILNDFDLTKALV